VSESTRIVATRFPFPIERFSVIRHTVAFRLVHPDGSEAQAGFLEAARELADIPGVEKFEQLRQIGSKTDFTFGFSMEFADAAAYAAYDHHPTHVAFVAQRWVPEVADFLELDYEPLV
jgi:hypothetical protein